MKFEAFRKPKPIAIEIEGEEFHVELPTRWNKAFTRAWQEKVAASMKVDEDGTIDRSNMLAADLQEAQMEAFADNCILTGPLPPAELKNEFYPLLETLYRRAEELGNELEKKADAAVGKSLPTSNGNEDGKVKSSSTTVSSIKAA